jgi:hypothetical protein
LADDLRFAARSSLSLNQTGAAGAVSKRGNVRLATPPNSATPLFHSEPIFSPLERARRALAAFAADPVEFYTRVATDLSERPETRRPVRPYVAEADWDAQLHAHHGLATPCAVAAEAAPVWDDILARMTREGIVAGPMSYLGWNDGDLGLARAVWCLARHLKAKRVVETGVAHGVTSSFVLEALARNGGGRLWSIDLPPMLHPEVHGRIGVAVDERLEGSWTLIRGSSRRHLPGLLARAAPIDLFIHDSKHSTGNVLFELQLAWAALRPGGAVVVDDIDTNNGFHQFCETVDHGRAWVCEAEPVRPDDRRSNRKGYFGVVLKGG